MSALVDQSDDPNQTGVLGESATSGGGSGVYGRGRTPKGNGVIGYSENGRGVWGLAKLDSEFLVKALMVEAWWLLVHLPRNSYTPQDVKGLPA